MDRVNRENWTAPASSDQLDYPVSVLVVTKDRDLRERITVHLGEHGCRVVGASDMPPADRRGESPA